MIDSFQTLIKNVSQLVQPVYSVCKHACVCVCVYAYVCTYVYACVCVRAVVNKTVYDVIKTELF